MQGRFRDDPQWLPASPLHDKYHDGVDLHKLLRQKLSTGALEEFSLQISDEAANKERIQEINDIYEIKVRFTEQKEEKPKNADEEITKEEKAVEEARSR